MAFQLARGLLLGQPPPPPAPHSQSQSHPRRRRRRRPTLCVRAQPRSDVVPSTLTIIEDCAGSGAQRFKGRRVYITDVGQGQCDVFENYTADGSPKGTLTSPPSRPFNDALRRFFLPTGYPDCVSRDYVPFVRWNTLRHASSHAFGVLGTQTMLLALGLGQSSLALSAALNWVIKDGAGMGVKVLISSSLAPLVDLDPKRWRLSGDILMTLGTALEIATAYFPHLFLIFASLGNIAKMGAKAATGPTYRIFLNSFALESNIGDVSARAEVQIVLGNLIGLGCGVLTSTVYVGQDPARAIQVYVALAAIHIACTVKSLECIELRTINWARLHLILDEFLETSTAASVPKINQAERISIIPQVLQRDIVVGADFLDQLESGKEAAQLLSLHRDDKFMVGCNNGKVGIMLRVDASGEDTIVAVLQARCLISDLQQSGFCLDDKVDRDELWKSMCRAHDKAHSSADKLLSGLRSNNWELGRLVLKTKPSRYKVEKDDEVNVDFKV